MEFQQTLAALRAWSSNPEAEMAQFSSGEQEAALRVVQSLKRGFADAIVASRYDHLQGLLEVGEPHGHLVAYRRGSEQAEQILRG